MTHRPLVLNLAHLFLLVTLFTTLPACKDPGPNLSRTTSQGDARKRQVKEQFSSWDGSNKALTKYVRQSLTNPQSFEHVRTTFEDRVIHLIVTMTYKSRNGAGTVVTNTIVAKVDLNGKVVEVVSRR